MFKRKIQRRTIFRVYMSSKVSEHKGTLYIVATPIGNLKDITIRAIEVLKTVDLVACEDTRRARILFGAYDIKTPLTSLFEHNEEEKSLSLMSRLEEGQDIAYITDAGTPCLSDPGYILIRQALARGIKVVPVPGPSAITTALCASGVAGGNFIFDGFIPPSSTKRKKYFAAIAGESRPIVLFESPKRLLASLADMRTILGDRKLVISRELTKVFEEIMRGSITELLEQNATRSIKGEITIILEPATQEEQTIIPDPQEIKALFTEITKDGRTSARDAVRTLALKLKLPRQHIYQAVFQPLPSRTA